LGGGGFTVGPRHANQAQTFGRLMIETPGQRRQALAKLAQVNHRHAMHFANFTVFSFAFRFSDNGGNPLGDGLRNIAASIRLMANYGDKQIPGSRNTAV
jgi:hypothetical protein